MFKKDEIFKLENSFNLDQSKIYVGESNIPLTLIFDFSENIHPYRMKNIKVTQTESVKSLSQDSNVRSFVPTKPPQSNNFLKMLNDDFVDEEELAEKNKKNHANNMEEKEEEINTNITKQDLYKMEEDKLFELMDFEHSIKNWNDFCQVK